MSNLYDYAHNFVVDELLWLMDQRKHVVKITPIARESDQIFARFAFDDGSCHEFQIPLWGFQQHWEEAKDVLLRFQPDMNIEDLNPETLNRMAPVIQVEIDKAERLREESDAWKLHLEKERRTALASRAFYRKDYQTVVDLLACDETELRGSLLQKLLFAKRQLPQRSDQA